MTATTRLVTAFVILLVLASGAYGVTIKGNNNGKASYKATITAPNKGVVEAHSVFTEDGISRELEGCGNLEEIHWVTNDDGARAEIGVHIARASSYWYGYQLSPGEGGGWSADEVSASESLNVEGANYIKAYAKAANAKGDDAGVSMRVWKGSLIGYTNMATASADGVTASQSFVDPESSENIAGASGKRVESKVWSTSTSDWLPFEEPVIADYEVKTTITDGSFRGDAEASSFDRYAKQGVLSATGDSITVKDSRTVGDDKQKVTIQSGDGSIVDKELISTDSGTIIQDAIDFADDGDSIKVADGMYQENLAIDKSLNIKGDGADKTIVDGNDTDRPFTIGLVDPNVSVALSGMTIQNGRGYNGGGIHNQADLRVTDCIISENHADADGGGIYNAGTMTLKDSEISNNEAPNDWHGGGGIYNSGDMSVNDCVISDNYAWSSGAGIFNIGSMTVKDSEISNNEGRYEAGIGNHGWMTVTDSTISGNIAKKYWHSPANTYWGGKGGGLSNDGGYLLVENCNIYENIAELGGGAISQWEVSSSTLEVVNSVISDNEAPLGGGIYNLNGTAIVSGCDITNNEAYSYGGGIYNEDQLELNECEFSDNIALVDGGGIYNTGTMTGEDTCNFDNNLPNDIAPLPSV